MSDTSKAKFPDDMTALRVSEGNDLVYKILGAKEVVATIYAPDKEMLEYRAMQFRCLPQMVALLKELKQLDDDDRLNLGSVKVNVESILRDIGEVE